MELHPLIIIIVGCAVSKSSILHSIIFLGGWKIRTGSERSDELFYEIDCWHLVKRFFYGISSVCGELSNDAFLKVIIS